MSSPNKNNTNAAGQQPPVGASNLESAANALTQRLYTRASKLEKPHFTINQQQQQQQQRTAPIPNTLPPLTKNVNTVSVNFLVSFFKRAKRLSFYSRQISLHIFSERQKYGHLHHR